MKSFTDILASTLASLVAILIVFIILVVEGAAVMLHWKWFIVPLGVAGINLWHGAGISVFVALLTYQTRLEDPKNIWVPMFRGLKVTVVSVIIGLGLQWFV